MAKNNTKTVPVVPTTKASKGSAKNVNGVSARVPGALSKSKDSGLIRENDSQMPLSRINFILMAVCGLMIILGFVLMAGGATTTDQFNPDIFSARRIVVGPAISFIGFVLMAFAILYRKPSRTYA